MMRDEALALWIGGERIAVPLAHVHSLVEVPHVTPAPRAPAHILGLAAIRSQALTVIDPYIALHLPKPDASQSPDTERQALVVEYEKCRYALLIDAVDGVTNLLGEPSATTTNMLPGWVHAGIGEIETDMGIMLLIDPAAIISGIPEMARRKGDLQQSKAARGRRKKVKGAA